MNWFASVFGVALGISGPVLRASEILPPGHRPLPPDAHAFTNARLILDPKTIVTNGTLIIRNGRVESAGASLPIPPDARVWNLAGASLYPAFIEPYWVQSSAAQPINTAQFMPIQNNSVESLTAGGHFGFYGVPGEERDPGAPGVGYELGTITPERQMAAQFVPDLKGAEELRELGFAVACAAPDKGILRGESCLISLAEANPNEVMLKSELFQHIAFDTDSGKENAYPKSLMGVIAAWRQVFLDAARYAEEQGAYARSPKQGQRPALNAALAALQPASEGRQRVILEPGSALMMDRAAKVARELKLDFALVSCGQEWRRPDLVAGWGAPIIVPAAFPSLPRFAQEDDWIQVSLDPLRAWDWAPENAALLRQKGATIALTTYGLTERGDFRKNLRRALDRGLSETDALAALTLVPARLCGAEDQLGSLEAGKLANFFILDGASYFDPEARLREVWIEGRRYPAKSEPPTPPKPSDKPKPKPTDKTRDLEKTRIARSPLEGRGPIASPQAVLIDDATLWTCGPSGKVENGSLLIVDGKIQGAGRVVTVPAELGPKLIRVSATGMHVTPGLIDAHNHSMILGGVNEGTLPSTAMVRIRDVINSEAGTIYQQLAGGLTAANELHGSANPIGGQNAVIKLRDGAAPDDLLMVDAPPGIKFALGENVKQSNWGEKSVTRYPQTRMGVPSFYANRFTAARQYLADWERFRAQGGLAPRRDLELEALGEILEGKRWIHCHSYRQDEILAFLRVMEDFGVRVATLQHVLEGYKIADEIARHGAGASCFSDWWAYKFEVYDAIPYAGSLMHQRGVLVSFNSDSSDLARRLNLEAAKAVKYGGVSEEDALKFVTINPARQLRIDSKVGSLEPGKDGDFVLWSGSPLDSSTRCLQTWIEGRKYFDRELEPKRASALASERTRLIEKAKAILGSADAPVGSDASRAAFFRRAWETTRRLDVQQCQDCLLPRSQP
ncbi:MAG: amidohydrolase family protein [Verrucomicrobia bacterium]|nr:amidohydrolase family protein [Verrucomicrobiota bacterium]